MTDFASPRTEAGSTYKVLGFLCALPVSINIESRETLLVHLFLFLPLSLAILALGARTWVNTTTIDRCAIAYFAWAAISVLMNLLGAVWTGGESSIVPRLASSAAILLYGVLPFLIARLLFRSDASLRAFFEGMMLGLLVTSLVLLAYYAFTWVTDAELARYAIGQRVVAGVCFLSVILIFLSGLRLRTYGILFMAWLVVGLSETRAALGQLAICLLLTVWLGTSFGRFQRAAIAALSVAAVVVGVSVGYALTRIEWLFVTTLEADQSFGLVDHSSIIRLMIWDVVTAKVFEDLLTAIFGFGQLGPAYITERFTYLGHEIEMFSAHSEYIDQLARGGIVYLGLFILLYVTVVVSSFRVITRSQLLGPLYQGVAIGLIGVAVYGLFHESTRYPWLGVLFWVVAGGLSNFWSRVSQPKEHLHPRLATYDAGSPGN